tara:strand:- start:1172 stop:2101 length:930 start_codon:yes stop_codon:yes gene_type:complete
MESGVMGIGNRYDNSYQLEQATLEHIPAETETYQPIGFHELIEIVKVSANETNLGLGYDSSFDAIKKTVDVNDVKENYLISKNHKQFFGTLTYGLKEYIEDPEIESIYGAPDITELTIGIRSSYDKTMSSGIAIGGRVIVCSNLMFVGDITYMRKHTKNSIDDIINQMDAAIRNQVQEYNTVQLLKERLKNINIPHKVGNYLLGNLFGNRLINGGQLLTASNCWNNLYYHQQFMQHCNNVLGNKIDKTLWVLYNCITEGLKKNTPMNMMTQHKKVHDAFTEDIIDCGRGKAIDGQQVHSIINNFKGGIA